MVRGVGTIDSTLVFNFSISEHNTVVEFFVDFDRVFDS